MRDLGPKFSVLLHLCLATVCAQFLRGRILRMALCMALEVLFFTLES